MRNFIKGVAIFFAGAIASNTIKSLLIEKGEVIYNNDDFYVKAAKDKTYGYSLAEVRWKNPE